MINLKLVTASIFFLLLISSNYAQERIRVEDYLEEANHLNETKEQHITEGNIKKVVGDYSDSPKEVDYLEKELKEKSQKEFSTSISQREIGNKDSTVNAGALIKESHATRKQFNDLDKEGKIFNKSDLITENPLIGVGSDCAISGQENSNIEVKPEPYEVTISDTRLIETDEKCEEDSKETYYCTRKLKPGGCADKYLCPFGGNEGGLFTAASNNELMQVSGGLTLKYHDTILELGNDRHWTYDAGKYGCQLREFTAKFYINNLAQVSVFRLFEVFENNLLHISVNGVTIYNGIGGTDLNLGHGVGMGKVIYSSNGARGTCGINEGHTHWKVAHYDILGAGILREGENHIYIRLVYHWLGHAGFKMEAKKYCCRTWGADFWEGDCP